MARCECPMERSIDGNSNGKFQNSRQVVLRQLNATGSRGKKRRFKAFLEECRFELVRSVFRDLGAVEVNFVGPWVLAWIDGIVPQEHLPRMKTYQKLNHFPGMYEICKKDLLAANLKRMKALFPKEYNFFPATFCLPHEARHLSMYCKQKSGFFIIKPDSSSQGVGIEIVKGVRNVKKYANVVCQKYIAKPLLMEGVKFDVRLYVLVTSVSPLRAYLYKEGLVRLATMPYRPPCASNLSQKRMHLTNYAINKGWPTVHPDEGSGSCKRPLSELENLLSSRGLDPERLWCAVDGLVVKTLLSALPALQRIFHASFPTLPATSPCFEILGFDVLLDHRAKPFLLEVNRSPSLGSSSPTDRQLKQGLVRNVVEMVLPTAQQVTLLDSEQHLKARKRLVNFNFKHPTAKERIVAESQLQRELSNAGGFRVLFPADDGRYDAILKAAQPPSPEGSEDSDPSSE